MNILAFDASSPWFAAACTAGARGTHLFRHLGMSHQEQILPLLDEVLGAAGIRAGDLEGLVVGKGPGSFTGLRVAMAAAKGMALGLGVPLVSVSALDAMALAAGQDGSLVVPVLDARKQRYYGGLWLGGERLGPYFDLGAADLCRIIVDARAGRGLSDVILTGPDAGAALEELRPLWPEGTALPRIVPPGDEGWGPALARLGGDLLARGVVDDASAGPEYVRSSDAELGIT